MPSRCITRAYSRCREVDRGGLTRPANQALLPRQQPQVSGNFSFVLLLNLVALFVSILPLIAGRQRQLSSAVLRKARKMSSGEGSRGVSYGNPFLRASSRLHQQTTRTAAQHSSSVAAGKVTMSSSKIMTSSLSNESASGNPFFAQLAKKDNPAASSNPAKDFPLPPPPPFPTTQTVPRPPSYASALTGMSGIYTSLQGPIPSFTYCLWSRYHTTGNAELTVQSSIVESLIRDTLKEMRTP